MPTFLLCSSKHSTTQVWFIFQVYLIALGWHNVNLGPTTVTNNSVPLNTHPFHHCSEAIIPSECNSLGCYKTHDNSKWKILEKRGLHTLHLKINSLLPKIDEIRLIAKQSNASITRISKPKVDSSILNNEPDTDDYDLIRLDRSRRNDRVACYIRKSVSYNHKTSFCRGTESISIDIFLTKSKLILVGVLYRPPNKPDFIEHVKNYLKESHICKTKECYIIDDCNVNL